VHHLIRHEWWWHSSIILLPLSTYRQYDDASARSTVKERAEKDKCMYICAHVTVGLVRVELKISTFYSLQ
jgi:hypothetical protein